MDLLLVTKKNSLVGICIFIFACLILLFPNYTKAATLSVSPATGVYQSGSVFTVQVGVNTQGKTINAADGTLKFNPQELQVVSANRNGSIFSLWTAEPAFSNSAGTVTFSGGSPSGYSGTFGNVITVTFRVVASGTAKVSITNGSVLAADGMGTNVLSSMNGGTYTLSAVSNQPTPEVIVEYVAPANTPPQPVITSATHGESGNWSNNNTAELRWTLPTGVTAVRTLLDTVPTSIPTKVYETPISSITLNDLDDGISYFHLQFKNANGWGKVAHYQLAIDSQPLPPVMIALADGVTPTDPVKRIAVATERESGAPLVRYEYSINGGETVTITDKALLDEFSLPPQSPGNYTLVLTAFTAAGASAVSTLTFTVDAFTAPTITAIPDRINNRTLPVIQGETLPGATVTLTLRKGTREARRYTAVASPDGVYSIIIDEPLEKGVYEVTVEAVDKTGAQSQVSNVHQFVVEEPGYIAFGTMMINIVSVILSLVSLVVVTVLVALFGIRKFLMLRRVVSKEADEVLMIMKQEFTSLQSTLHSEATAVAESRKTKTLTKAEQHLVDTIKTALIRAEKKITKEATDVTQLTD